LVWVLFCCNFFFIIDKEEENTKVKSEDKLLAQIEKLSKGSKKEIRERKVYVPPGRQRAGI
jgi:hypothetical protein